MKKLFIFLTMLVLGIVSSWATTGTITVKGASDTNFSANGTWSKCKTTWATMWQSNTTPCLTITSTNHSRYMSGTLLANADYAMFLPLGYRITGYTISFKSNANGNSKITGYGEKKASKGSVTSTGTTDEKTLTVSGISTQSVEFKVETNIANVTLFTVNYETADDVMPFVQGGYYRLKEYSGWVTNYYLYAYRSDSNTDRLKKGSADANRVLTHSNYIWKASSVSGSQVQFQNELYGYYMAKLPTSAGQVAASITSSIDDAETFNVINRSAWGAGYISLLAQSPITTAMTVNQGDNISYPFHFLDGCSSSDSLMNGLHYEHQGDVLSVTRVKKVTFSQAVSVNELADPVSTIYVTTDGNDSFTLPNTKLYKIGDAEPLHAPEAVEAITAAGTDDISVTVSDNPYVDLVYNLKFGGSVISVSSIQYDTPGEAPKAAATLFGTAPAYCSYSAPSPATITNETTEVNYTLEWDGPFDISSDFNSAKWYYLKFGNLWVSYAEGEDHEASTSNSQSTTSESMWAFLGNPKDGIKIVNRKKGDGYYLEFAGYAKMKASGYINITIEENGDNTYANVGGGYYAASFVDGLGIKTGYDGDRCIMTVEAAPYKDQALVYLTEYAASHHMGEYFGVDESSYNKVKDDVSNLESMTENDYNTLVSNITIQLSPKLPETGYYRIKSSGSRGDQSYITYGYLDGSKGTGLLTTIGNKETDLGTVVKLTRVGTGKNYKISIQGLNVQAHSGDNNLFRATGAEGQNFQFNHINFSGMCSIYDGTDHGNMHEAGWKKPDTGLNGVVGWTTGDGTNASSWSVEDATTCTVTLNSDGATTPTYYATLCVPFDVTISDATAYTLAKSESGNYLVPTEVDQVPAGTPVLLKGTSATATLTIGSGYAESPLATTALTGTYVATTVDTRNASGNASGNNYVFGKNSSGAIGFYHVNNQYFPLKANRAYMNTSASNARGFSLMFDDDVTGIVSTSGETEEGAVIYNISGQRLNKMQKGINIVNGKKVLF